ncbi:MAG: hypothetical protein AAFP19_10720, partial [Bacteroidota bacterium]
FIALLENKTGISLSLSTVKRIWSMDYNGHPHPTTLDALAQFLDYDNWLSFQAHHKAQILSGQPKQNANSSRGRKRLLLMLFLFVVGLGFILLLKYAAGQKHLAKPSANSPRFSAFNAQTTGLPNTVIFKYDLADIEADSFFIQQSWNPLNRQRISREDSVLTSIYYYPGVHTAKLIANETVVKKDTLNIYSNGWVATALNTKKGPIPSYIPLEEVDGKRKLEMTKARLVKYHSTIDQDLELSYFYVAPMAKVSGDHFALLAQLKADSLLNITCPSIRLMVIGTLETHAIGLIDKGCVHSAFAKFGKQVIMGKNSDLSALGISVYKEQQLSIDLQEKRVRVYLNDQLALETTYENSIGDITGLGFSFSGVGRVDSIKLNNYDGQVIFTY